MNITFLIGNGFDLALGLKSSYTDFIKWYSARESSVQHIAEFKSCIKNDINNNMGKNWSDFEAALGQYTTHFDLNTINRFFDCYEDARKDLMLYLKQESERFSDEVSNDSIMKFKKRLLNYYAELKPKDKRNLDGQFPQNPNYNVTMRFVSFNYTSFLDNLVAKVSKTPLLEWSYGATRHTWTVNPYVIHVHGTCEQFPIFGVNDESQIANKELLRNSHFKSIMIKPQSVDAIDEVWHDDAMKEIANSNVICIYGMSLGKTDACWFERIMKWLREDTSRHVIIYWYTKEPSDGLSIITWIQNRDAVRGILTGYSSFKTEIIESVVSRIHVIENTQVICPQALTRSNVNLSTAV